MLKRKLEEYRALVSENRDFIDKIVPERQKSEPAFEWAKDEAYLARCKKIDALSGEIEALRAEEDRATRFDNEPKTRQINQPGNRNNPDDGLTCYREMVIRMGRTEATADQDAAEMRDFHNYLLSGSNDLLGQHLSKVRSNLITTGTTTGGYGVPTFWVAQIIHDLDAMESVRKAGPAMMDITGVTNLTSMAKVTANRVAEAASISATDLTVGRVTLTPTKLVCATTGSWEIFNRFVADLGTEIRRAFAQGIAEKEGGEFLTGSGSGEPQGLTVGGGQGGATTASATAITAAEVIALHYAMNPMYLGGARYFLNGTTAALLRPLSYGTTSVPLPLFVDGPDGTPRIMGVPVVLEPLMPAPTAALKPIVLANVPVGYLIGEEKGMSVLVNPYSADATGETKITMYKFNDGRVRVAAAVKYLLMHA